jgi:uncharacterized damage-inducible protein DinB
MTDFNKVAADNRKAVAEFCAAAGTFDPEAWERSPAEGKWSPRQITEHLALTYELSKGILHGEFPGRSMPGFVRPVIRALALKPVLKKRRFGRPVKTFPAFEPGASPTAGDALSARVQQASAALEEEMQQMAAKGEGMLNHPFFGKVSLADYMLLQVIHTDHHRGQLPK